MRAPAPLECLAPVPQPVESSARRLVCGLAAALLLLPALSARAQPLLLVSEDEVAREAATPPSGLVARALPQPDAPVIRVLAPALGSEPLGSPMRIELVFTAAADAEIDPLSFRAQYGALRTDLTDRILRRVSVGKSGLALDNVLIPPGNHRLRLLIADTRARVGEAELRFVVR